DRRLAAEGRKTLLGWLDNGTPKGSNKDLPPPRKFESDWTIGKPDLILSMPEEFAVPATAPKNGIEYQFINIKTNFKEDRWVVRAEAKVGAPEVVQHCDMLRGERGRICAQRRQSPAALRHGAPRDTPELFPPRGQKNPARPPPHLSET